MVKDACFGISYRCHALSCHVMLLSHTSLELDQLKLTNCFDLSTSRSRHPTSMPQFVTGHASLMHGETYIGVC